MRFVIDTNEFVSALGLVKHHASELLLAKLIDTFPTHTIHIPRTIVNEVRRNLPPLLFTQFIKITQSIATVNEDIIVPFEIGAKF